jgi:hypothetical protein
MSTLYTILYWSTPAVFVLATIEAAILSAVRRDYDWRAYLASTADLLVRQYVVYVFLAFGIAVPLIGWAWRHRVATVPFGNFGAAAALFLGRVVN